MARFSRNAQQSIETFVESLGLDEGELFNMYREVPSITEKAASNFRYQYRLTCLGSSPFLSFDEHESPTTQRNVSIRLTTMGSCYVGASHREPQLV